MLTTYRTFCGVSSPSEKVTTEKRLTENLYYLSIRTNLILFSYLPSICPVVKSIKIHYSNKKAISLILYGDHIHNINV